MTKQSKNTFFSNFFENIDLEIAVILRKCNEGENFNKLKDCDKEKLWNALLNLLKANCVAEANSTNIQVIKNCAELLWNVLSTNQSDVEGNELVINIIRFFNSEEYVTDTPALNNLIGKLNEYCMSKLQMHLTVPELEYSVLKRLLTLCTTEKPVGADIQKLCNVRKAMTSEPFERAVPSLKPLLIKAVESIPMLESDYGQRFIAQCLLLSHKLMMDVHKTVMLDLGSCIKKKATNYGKVYILAWLSASDDTKFQLEKSCFQHLMETFLKEHRTSLELSKSSQNLLKILEIWHSERKKKHPGFVTMITNAYQPILWKYLQSGFNMHRCNASDVFFKAFPLQRTDDNAVDAEKFFNMQYEAMLACLTDDCHIVRIIAIRETCNIISHYWNSFTPIQIQTILKIITKECANDLSSAEVRRMVYIGFQSLIKSPLSCEYIKQVLPNLANNIHDINQKVRIAFIQLLICIKEKNDSNFKYSDVVPMTHIQYRLADDNATVGQWIVKLLLKNYYRPEMAVVEWTKRFIYMIKSYSKSYRNFFFYSIKCLSFKDACTIIYETLSQLGMFVLSKTDRDSEDSENRVERPVGKRKGNKKVALADRNGRISSSEPDKTISKKCAFDDPEVVSGLFDIVTILWVLHDIKLNKPENEEMRLKLYDTYIKYAQPFINYYKDCKLFLGVISLSGNIPASLLRHNSITLPGYCIKMLKSLNVERGDDEDQNIVCMLMALVKWGRGSEIIEQVTLWLDAVFETQNLNETILPRRRVKISEAYQPNSVVAISILDILFNKEYAKLSVLKKNYTELFNLWKFMSRIQQIVEIRLEQCEPFEVELLSDQFIKLCFRRYLKFIPLLKEDPTSEKSQNESEIKVIDQQKEIENVLQWADNLFCPVLEREDLEEADLDLVTSLIADILYVSDNMITIHIVDNMFHFKVCHFMLKLLGMKHGYHFLKPCSRVLTALNHSAKLLFNVSDDLKIFSTVIPSLLSHILNVLTRQKMNSNKVLQKIEEDLPIMKSNFGKILATYQDNLKSTSNLIQKARQLKLVTRLFADCILCLVAREIPKKDFSVPLYSTPAQLPPIANILITLFYNKKTWTPLFVHMLNARLSSRCDDVKTIIACILLLYVYGISDKKINKKEFKKTLSSAVKKLTELKNSVTLSKNKSLVGNKQNISSSNDRLESSKTPFELEDRLSKPQSRTDCQVTLPCKELRSDLSTVESQTLESSNCQSTENSLEEDFINCGFELISKIEDIIKSQPATLQED